MAVVGHETHSPVVTLAVVYNAGARHETDADIGLTHCLRMAVNQVMFAEELWSFAYISLCTKLHNFSFCSQLSGPKWTKFGKRIT